MRILFVIFSVVLASMVSPRCAAFDMHTPELINLYDSLDVALSHRVDYENLKLQRIHKLQAQLSRTTELERRYWLTREIYNEYRTFDSDSALSYLDSARKIALQAGRKDWRDEALLNSCYIYSATGLLDKSHEILAEINPDSLPQNLRMKYYESKLFLATHKGQFFDEETGGAPYTAQVDSLLRSIVASIQPSDPDYIWFMGWHAMNSSADATEAIKTVLPYMADRAYDTVEDAKDAWMLGTLYKLAGDSTNFIKYISLSALADVRTANKEIASLEELAEQLYNDRDYERANRYIAFSIQAANDYKSRVRVGRLAALQYNISDGFSRELAQSAHVRYKYMWGLAGIIFICFLALCFIVVQMRRLKKSRIALKETNDILNERVAELKSARASLDEINRQLHEQYNSVQQDARELSVNNEAKERYIADIFTICSDYISKIDDFRKKINRMIIAGRIDDVRELTKSPELSQSELRELYNNFDKIFLKIFPDFVSDFNSLLYPDKHIEPRKGELLTTELRIFALVRLGLNDSVKIAKFLHYSPQTVYNTRQRTRNKSPLTKEEFAAAVMRLGTPHL